MSTLAINGTSTSDTELDSRKPHKGWTLGLTSLGVFMVALDTLIVATALPVLRVDLGATLADLEFHSANDRSQRLAAIGKATFGPRRVIALERQEIAR
jgi:hypothetical protein